MSLDLMLTSRRLILIDNSVNPFHLRTIPLDSIITVVAGMDVKGEPVFTLSHMDPSGSGAPQPMDFIFMRQKGKSRAKECNEWAATLNIHAAGARNGALSSGTLPYDPVKTIQPRMSATYMIETFSPRKPVMEAYPVKAGPVTTPVISKFPVGGGILAGIDEPAPLKNVEMVEPFDSPWLLPPEPEKMEMSDKHEPASPLPVIAIEADGKPAITDREEPVSPPLANTTGTNETPTITDAAQVWADAVRTATTPSPVIPLMMTSATIPEEKKIDDKLKVEQISTSFEEPVAEINKDVSSADEMVSPCSADDEPVGLPARSEYSIPSAISPTVPKIPKSMYPNAQIAAIVIVILVVLGVAVISSFNLLNSGETTPPVVVPIVTVQPIHTPIPTLVPADGVWVRIKYPGNFIGEVGNPEIMHPAYGSGERIYKILWSDRSVHASAQKQENSGDTLTIEIYNNGTLIKSSSTRAPMGSVDILIDPTTGQPPGVKLGHIP